MKNRKIIPGLVCLAAGALMLLGLLAVRTQVIIQSGYPAWRTLMIVGAVLLAAGVLLVVSALVNGAMEESRRRRTIREATAIREEQKERQELARKMRTPGDIRRYFGDLTAEDPSLQPVLSSLTGQLDEIASLKEKMQQLLDMNDLEAFSGASDLLEQIEDYICGNCRKAANDYIIGDGCTDEFRTKVRRLCEDNESKLSDVRHFLAQLRDFANSREDGSDAAETLRVYAEAIRDSIT